MLSFLSKIIFKRTEVDAKIFGDFKLNAENTAYFTVKMRGCPTLVDISAHDIIEKFNDKFNRHDIILATKAYMKYSHPLKLALIEKNLAIFYHKHKKTYQMIDLNDSQFLKNIEINALKPEDAFLIGVHYEKMRFQKDIKQYEFFPSLKNIIPFIPGPR